MPRQTCQKNNRPGYRWGQSGTCYTYEPGNREARERAKRRAEEQGRAARASGYRDD